MSEVKKHRLTTIGKVDTLTIIVNKIIIRVIGTLEYWWWLIAVIRTERDDQPPKIILFA